MPSPKYFIQKMFEPTDFYLRMHQDCTHSIFANEQNGEFFSNSQSGKIRIFTATCMNLSLKIGRKVHQKVRRGRPLPEKPVSASDPGVLWLVN